MVAYVDSIATNGACVLGTMDTYSFTVNVLNNPPVIVSAPLSTIEVHVGATKQFTVTVNDPENCPLAFSGFNTTFILLSG
jgi:hypothetical protein